MATFDLFRNKEFLRPGRWPLAGRLLHRLEAASPATRICLAHGSLTSLLFVTGFLAAKNYQGVIALSELPLFYVLFLFAGVFLGLLKLASVQNNKVDYREGLKTGIRIATISVAAFALFLWAYLVSDQAALFDIQERLDYGEVVTPLTVAFRVLFEGLVSGLVISFGVMQYFKEF